MNWSGAAGAVTAVAISPDGRYVAAGGWVSPSVWLLSVQAKSWIGSDMRVIQQIRFSADGQVLAVANWAHRIFADEQATVAHSSLTYKDSQVKTIVNSFAHLPLAGVFIAMACYGSIMAKPSAYVI